MHLAHPSLSMLGKRKSKVKFRNAEQAKQQRELAQEWEKKQKEWASLSKPVKPIRKPVVKYSLSIPAGRDTTKNIPRLKDTHTGAVSSKAPQYYTGTKMIGIGTLHKSNAVPIFSDDEAKDISKMRRG